MPLDYVSVSALRVGSLSAFHFFVVLIFGCLSPFGFVFILQPQLLLEDAEDFNYVRIVAVRSVYSRCDMVGLTLWPAEFSPAAFMSSLAFLLSHSPLRRRGMSSRRPTPSVLSHLLT